MKPLIYTVAIALLLSLVPVPVSAQQSQPANDTPAARRALEFVKVINSGTREEVEAYVKGNYAPAFLNRFSMDDHLGFVDQFRDETRGVEFHSFQESSANSVVALLKARLTGGWKALSIQVEADPPNRIAGIGLRPPKPPADAAPARKLSDADVVKELEAFVQKLADADAFSGSVLLARDGQPLFKRAYGLASKEFDVPNRVDTKFNLGSMNKMFTAVAIAQLVERGKLSFDDPLSKFLPDFPTKEAAEKIRIKHLLTHTSGLGSYFNRKFMESSRALYRTVDDMMKLAIDEKPAFEPGARWSYSNTGFLVLGAVIEKVTGRSYYDYIRENIYKPAGMINSDCYELDLVTPNLALGYEKEHTSSGVRYRNNLFKHVIRGGPAGGGYSTVEDLLRFSVALRSNKLVGPEYTRLLMSPKPDLNSPRYGYGFGIDTEQGTAGHSGGFPGISSDLTMFLNSGYTAVVMSNYGSGSPPVVEKIRELMSSVQPH
ncbi:MAG TPA: serine hydrolase domain-containing protein [Blastocatellia bacterium]|nr:serine hydrolase domain-containing protein [Blastocatellia bacterium]